MEKCPLCNSERIPGKNMCQECGYIFSPSAGTGTIEYEEYRAYTEYHDPFIGKILDNKYVITEIIGTGGMGAVYKGEQQFLEKTVAIKILEGDKIEDERAVAMFYREARLAARLNHPNSITIYDFGKTPEGVLYMVMEFLRGESLASILLQESVLTPAKTASVVRQVCLALEAAHTIGLVHRDLKPENIFIEKLSEDHEHVTVLDFGIAKQLKMGDPSLTNPGMVWGTPLYMSPEQATGKPIDQRTDIYSLGVVMYEMLCGEPPFISDNPTEILIAHVHDEPTPPTKVAPDLAIPPALEAITLWAMAKKPDDRISSVSEFRKALESWLAVSDETEEPGQCRVCGAHLSPGVVKCPICLHENHSESAEHHSLKGDEGSAPSEVALGGPSLRLSDPLSSSSGRLRVPKHASTKEVDLDKIIEEIDSFMEDHSGAEKKVRSLRRVELEKLRSLMAQCRSTIISGEDGIGKSHFIKEFKSLYGGQFPPLLILELGSICAGDPFVKFRRYLESIVGLKFLNALSTNGQEGVLPGHINALFNILDTEFRPANPESWRLEAAASFKAVAQCYLEEVPHILVIKGLESVHDFADSFWSVINKVYGFHTGAPLIISTHSTSFNPNSSAWGRIELHGINLEQLLALSSKIIGSELPGWFGEGLGKIGGNPFYLLQMLDLYMEETLPESFANRNELIEVRLNQLPVRARELLQVLAISEDGLSLGILEQFLDMGRDELNHSIELCLRKGIIIEHNREYILEHAIWRDLIGANLPGGVRKEFYKRFLLFDREGSLALSLSQRGRFAEEVGKYDLAMEAWERIGQNSLNYGARTYAIEAMGRAFAAARRHWMMNPAMEMVEIEYIVTIAVKLAFLMRDEGKIQSSIAMIQDLMELVHDTPGPLARLLITVAQLYFSEGIYSKTEVYLDRYLDLTATSGAPLSVDAYKLFLEVYSIKGNHYQSLDVISGYLMSVPPEHWHYTFLNAVGEFFFFLGARKTAKKWWILGSIYELEAEGDAPHSEDQLFRYYMESGDFSGAENHLYAQLYIMEAQGDLLGQGNVLLRLAQLALQQENKDEANALFKKTAQLAEELEWQEGLDITRSFLQMG